MYCKNCGKEIADNEKFCTKCGEKIDTPVPAVTVQSDASQNNKNKKSFPKFILIVLLILIVMGTKSCIGGNSYEDVVDDYLSGMMEADAKKMLSTFTEDYIDTLIIHNYCENKAELTEFLQDGLEDLEDHAKDTLGKNWDYEYEITNVDKFENEIVVSYNLYASGKLGNDSTSGTLYMIKEGNNWRIYQQYGL